MVAAEQAVGVKGVSGRPGANIDASHSGAGTTSQPAASDAGEPMLATALRTYEQLGAEPPTVDFVRNDEENGPAHTLERHGSHVPLRRDPNVRTIEGRIYNDKGWERAENQSFRWDDPVIMAREVNGYIRRNWETIRSDLALEGRHKGHFDAGHRVGEGFINSGMHGTGPRQAHYMVTSLVRVTINLVADSDPAKAFVVSAFPAGILR
ncbi:hypothetical protein [Actinoplanes sp. URMC 104]|uniref:hypothetical protein n=1 Tax=Actinoplanes sp. URMC 104 TaxID=3423409 RepID=UPI003F1A411B